MNTIENNLKQAIKDAVEKQFSIPLEWDEIVIEIPKDTSHGDYATNTAMRITKRVQKNPREVAQGIIDGLCFEDAAIESASIAGPGFINFVMKSDSLANIINVVLEQQDQFGCNDFGKGIKINCEYVSANPTGDLHLGHARGAAWGDSVTRILKASGFDVTREYYVNDAGNQIINLGKSLYARYCEQFNVEVALPEDGYHGPDVIAIAKKIADKIGDIYVGKEDDTTIDFFKKEGIKYELEKIKEDLDMFRVHFDVWSSEQSIRDAHKVEEAVEVLDKLGDVYEEEGALWFQTTKYGDDKDRVLRKSDGSYTYLVPDIAYHINKLDRGYDKLVDFLGADHHGYIPRLKASIQALGRDADTLEVDIIQMVRLVEDGEEVKMSKRLGNAVTIRDLCEEVGVDAVRYFFVSRAVDTHFDFDLGLARKQSNDNPVYYAQYAYARMCSILRNIEGLEEVNSFDLLTHEKEIQLLKYINEFTNVVKDAAKNRAPHKVCNYIQKLAAYFHSFYVACKVNDSENLQLSAQRVALLKACRITLKNALNLIGVEAIEKM